MTVPNATRVLSPLLLRVLLAAGVVDIVLGAVLFTGPETGIGIWPTAISPILLRFVGGIVAASGVGVVVAALQKTWEGARALFWVGLVYSLATLVALVYHLLALGAPAAFWIYAAFDVGYLVPIAWVLVSNERAGR